MAAPPALLIRLNIHSEAPLSDESRQGEIERGRGVSQQIGSCTSGAATR